MKKNDNAVSPVISAVLALMIVTSTMTAVFVWGVPYIDQLNTVAATENSLNQFTSVIDSIGELTNSYSNDSRINTLSITKGEVTADNSEDEKDRTVVMYSYDDDHDFTVSGFDTCFLAGTKVLMADGSYKNIEEINIGDMVLSYHEHTKRIVPCRVANVFAHHPNEMAGYYLLINNGLRVTPNHRFYSDGRWVYAGNLKVGDSLFSKDMGSSYQVVSIKKIYERAESFDLEVESCHTYFVSIESSGVDVLVHNAPGDPDPGDPGIPGQGQQLWSVDAGGPYFGHINVEKTFTATIIGNIPCPGCNPNVGYLVFDWDMDSDGEIDRNEYCDHTTTTYTYTAKGTYTITLNVYCLNDQTIIKTDTATVYIYEPMVLYPEKDTHIREYNGEFGGGRWRYKNFGNSPKLSVDSTFGITDLIQGRENTLIRFNLFNVLNSLINSTIISATLRLWYYQWGTGGTGVFAGVNPAGSHLDCHRLIFDWDEGTGGDPNGVEGVANWEYRLRDTESGENISWINEGGDYDSSVTSSLTIPDIGNKPSFNKAQWMNWSVTEDVKNFLKGVYPNHGWLIKYQEYSFTKSHLVNFSSDETTKGDDYKPKLEVIYLKTQTLNTTNVKKYKEDKAKATLKGLVVSDADNGCNYSFYYKKYNDYYWNFAGWSQTLIGKTEFSKTIQNLVPGCLYEYRASIKCRYQSKNYLNNGSKMKFLTPGNITGFSATAFSPGAINLEWQNAMGAKGAYIEWYTSPDTTWERGDHYKVDADGYCKGTRFLHTGLEPNTNYYYKAWAYADDCDYTSDGTENFPWGNNWTRMDKTYQRPSISTEEPVVIHSRDAILNGYLTHTTQGENCMVWFEYGRTPACGTNSKTFNWTNGTGSYTFHIPIDGLKPGTIYYFQAVYKAIYRHGTEEYVYIYKDPDEKNFTTLISDIEIVSPQYGNSWIKGTNNTIKWFYKPQLDGTNITIWLIRPEGPYVLKEALPINSGSWDPDNIYSGSWDWEIPSDQTQTIGKFRYRILITSDFDPGSRDFSDYFTIKELHEGMVWHRTIVPIDEGDNTFLVDCGQSDCDRGESFHLKMIKGNLDRVEAYGLYYGGELCDCSFRGTVQIDLYDGSNCFGSIILLDSDSLTYKFQSGSGTYVSKIEKGGILYSDSTTNKYLQKAPPIYGDERTFSMHAVQLVVSPFGASGNSEFRIRAKTIVTINSIREKDYVYNLKIQFYGDNAELWLKYFESKHRGFERQSDTLFYKPSTSSVWFVFSQTAIQVSFI